MATQQASLLPNGRQQILDANGIPLVGGKVYFYAPGTTNPKTVWADPGQASPLTNPVVLDNLGSMSAYGIGSYRQIVLDQNNVQLWDQVVDSGTNSNGGSGGGGGGGNVSGVGSDGTTSVGIYITNLPAAENIAAGAPVNIFVSGGQPAIRNANAASTAKLECHGFLAVAVGQGSLGTVYANGLVSGLAGLTPGVDYYLGTGPGAITTTGANQSGQIFQRLGVGLNSTTLIIDLSPAVQC